MSKNSANKQNKTKIEVEKKKSYMYIGPTLKKYSLAHGTLIKGEGFPKLLKIENDKVEKELEELKKIPDKNKEKIDVLLEKKEAFKKIKSLIIPADKNIKVKITNISKEGTRERVVYGEIIEIIKKEVI